MVVGELQVPLAEAIAAETGQTLPTGIPDPGERWNDQSGGWVSETNRIISESPPEGVNPIDELRHLITDQTRSMYSDPENDRCGSDSQWAGSRRH